MKKILPYIFSLIVAFIVLFAVPQAVFAFDFVIPTPPVFNFVMPTLPIFNQQAYPVMTNIPTATPTKQPTSIPTYQPTNTPTPIQKLTVIPTSKPTVTPVSTVSSLLDSKQQYMLNAINDYRASYGLPKVTANKTTCDFAKIRAQEIVTDFSHNGFTSRANSRTLPYPSYHNVTENIAMTSDYTRVITLWKNSAGHAANMRADTPYVCVAYSGNYYAYEGWRP